MVKKISPKNVLVLGGRTGIGEAFIKSILNRYENVKIISTSRKLLQKNEYAAFLQLDTTIEESWKGFCNTIIQNKITFDLIINATGILHEFRNKIIPEKSIHKIHKAQFIKNMEVNALGTALAIKYLKEFVNNDQKVVFANLTARLGSIQDNIIGGWISYRSSKAAQHMIIKTASIELSRTKKNICLVGLHPGTVATELSRPFLKAAKSVFTSEYSTNKMLDVMESLDKKNSGKIYDFRGTIIPY